MVAFGTLAGERLLATLEITALEDGTTGAAVAQAHAFSDTTGRPLNIVFVPEPGQLTLLGAGIAQLLVLQRWRCRRQRR